MKCILVYVIIETVSDRKDAKDIRVLLIDEVGEEKGKERK